MEINRGKPGGIELGFWLSEVDQLDQSTDPAHN